MNLGSNEGRQRQGATNVWLVTFADISALLLAFFVMLFSMSTLEVEEWQKVVSRLKAGDQQSEPLRPQPNSANNVPTVDIRPALPLGYLTEVLDEKLRQDPVLAEAFIHRLDELVIVSLPSDVLFRPSDVELTSAARNALFRLSSAIAQIGNQIDVYGHAMAPTGARAPQSPWHLSLARAVSVANELKRLGYQQNVTMLGVGQSRFKHLDTNIPLERRRELVRRVDIVVHPTQGEP